MPQYSRDRQYWRATKCIETEKDNAMWMGGSCTVYMKYLIWYDPVEKNSSDWHRSPCSRSRVSQYSQSGWPWEQKQNTGSYKSVSIVWSWRSVRSLQIVVIPWTVCFVCNRVKYVYWINMIKANVFSNGGWWMIGELAFQNGKHFETLVKRAT